MASGMQQLTALLCGSVPLGLCQSWEWVLRPLLGAGNQGQHRDAVPRVLN